jgi:Na+/melibiose symporter-like transporter
MTEETDDKLRVLGEQLAQLRKEHVQTRKGSLYVMRNTGFLLLVLGGVFFIGGYSSADAVRGMIGVMGTLMLPFGIWSVAWSLRPMAERIMTIASCASRETHHVSTTTIMPDSKKSNPGRYPMTEETDRKMQKLEAELALLCKENAATRYGWLFLLRATGFLFMAIAGVFFLGGHGSSDALKPLFEILGTLTLVLGLWCTGWSLRPVAEMVMTTASRGKVA